MYRAFLRFDIERETCVFLINACVEENHSLTMVNFCLEQIILKIEILIFCHLWLVICKYGFCLCRAVVKQIHCHQGQ